MFVDSSAVVAILAKEPEHAAFKLKVEAARAVLVSPLVIYESTLALARITADLLADARLAMREFVAISGAQTVSIDDAVGDLALAAFERFGKGRHRAALNMADCFSYACAKSHRVPLLCKGGDFIHTDIDLA